jgi:hypothetical protein
MVIPHHCHCDPRRGEPVRSGINLVPIVIPAKAGIQILDHPIKPDDDKVRDCSQRDSRVAYAPCNDKDVT